MSCNTQHVSCNIIYLLFRYLLCDKCYVIRDINSMNIKPIHDKVVLKPVVADEVTKSGIVLPDTIDKERPEKGEVVAIGEGKLLENGQRAPMGVKVGDIVIFKKYSPDEIKVDDVEYLVISESDIMAVIN